MKVQALSLYVRLAILLPLILGRSEGKVDTLVHLNDDNWGQILEGEWMIGLFASWDNASQNVLPVWEEFSTLSKELGIRVALMDVSRSPQGVNPVVYTLAGPYCFKILFNITCMPAVVHHNEGVVRNYPGPGTKEAFVAFVVDKRWEGIEPVFSWPIAVYSHFKEKLAIHNKNTENVQGQKYATPSWANYLISLVVAILYGVLVMMGMNAFGVRTALPIWAEFAIYEVAYYYGGWLPFLAGIFIVGIRLHPGHQLLPRSPGR